MKYFLVLCTVFFQVNLLADVVDPIGDDPGFKSVQFQIKILDKIIYKTYGTDDVDFSFGSESSYFRISDLPAGTPPKTLNSKKYRMFETYAGDYYLKHNYEYLKKGELDKGFKLITSSLKRIDVNDMLVTKDDGTTYRARGTVRITMLDKSGNKLTTITSRMPTKRGVFVRTGFKYKVKVTASTEDDIDDYTVILDYTANK